MNAVLKNTWKIISKQKAVLAILGLLVLMLFPQTTFYSAYNWLDMLRNAAILEIVAMGVTVAVISGGCDLSVGGTLCIGGILAVMVINAGLPIFVGFLAAIAAGALIGVVNGFLIVHQRTEPFIITLGMGMLLKGVAQQLTNAHPLPCASKMYAKISNAKIFGDIPILVIYMIAVIALFYCIMRYTSFGRNLYAIGGNYDVAKYSGISVVPTKWTAYIISGITASLAGVLLAARMSSGSSIYGDNTGMLVNCGCVIGGTSFAGGIGGPIQSFIGVFMMQMLTNCMNMLGIDNYVQTMTEGFLIVLVIGLDCFGRMRQRQKGL